MLEKLSRKISLNIRENLNLSEEQISVVEYGLNAFFHMSISIILVAIVGLIFGVMYEALLISFCQAILRKYSGGVHATKPVNCIFMGILVSVLPAYLIKKNYYNINFIIIFGAICYIISYRIIYKLAPVDSVNKPIKKLEKIKKLKKGSIIILTIYMVIVIFNIIFYYITKNNIFLVYSICIYIGILWQVFTLTKIGHIIVNIIDYILIKIFNILRGNKK